MVVDFRAYTLKIGTVQAFLELFQRERRRAALYKDPAFAAYLKKARELIVKQEVRLLESRATTGAPC